MARKKKVDQEEDDDDANSNRGSPPSRPEKKRKVDARTNDPKKKNKVNDGSGRKTKTVTKVDKFAKKTTKPRSSDSEERSPSPAKKRSVRPGTRNKDFTGDDVEVEESDSPDDPAYNDKVDGGMWTVKMIWTMMWTMIIPVPHRMGRRVRTKPGKGPARGKVPKQVWYLSALKRPEDLRKHLIAACPYCITSVH